MTDSEKDALSNKKKHHDGHKDAEAQKKPSSTLAASAKAVPAGDADAPACKCHEGPCKGHEKPTKKSSNPDWWMVVLTGFLGIAAFATFWILWCQLEDARESFRIDQHPSVWIANPMGEHLNMDYETGYPPETIAVTTHYTNFGKSPALELQWGSGIEVGGDIQNGALSESKTVLPPNKNDFFTVTYTVNPSNPPGTAAALKAKARAIKIKLFWKYIDSSGVKYETDVCMWNIGDHAFGPCDSGNEVRDCSKQKCKY